MRSETYCSSPVSEGLGDLRYSYHLDRILPAGSVSFIVEYMSG